MGLGNMPAYPLERPAFSEQGTEYYWGMTIRQRYAMAAMQGMLSDVANTNSFVVNSKNWSDTKEKLAWTSFQIADAMVKFEEDENVKSKVKKTMGDKET